MRHLLPRLVGSFELPGTCPADSLPAPGIDVGIGFVEGMPVLAFVFSGMEVGSVPQLVLLIFGMRAVPQVLRAVVVAVAIQVPYLKAMWARAMERECYKSVNAVTRCFTFQSDSNLKPSVLLP